MLLTVPMLTKAQLPDRYRHSLMPDSLHTVAEEELLLAVTYPADALNKVHRITLITESKRIWSLQEKDQGIGSKRMKSCSVGNLDAFGRDTHTNSKNLR